MWVHDLRDADASCGGKAVGLARLIAAGLPVPDGFVIDGRGFTHLAGDCELGELAHRGHVLEQMARRIEQSELPPEVVAEVERRANSLGERVVVRSSATIEDRPAGAAAGVFSSRTAVNVADLWPAIRSVWLSALTPTAAAYAHGHGGLHAIGVIVQAFVPGTRATIYTRPAGHPNADEVLVQRGDRLDRIQRGSADPVVHIALAAETAIDAKAGADVELVISERAIHLVQARPIVHPEPRALVAAPPAVLAILQDGRVWTWDVAHNPDPLSVAQQQLVEQVREIGAYDLRVCAGFLYTSPRTHDVSQRDPMEIESELEAMLADLPLDLVAALALYRDFYRVWAGELAPAIAAARPSTPAARPSAVERTLLAAARGEISEQDVLDRLGALSPAWDVAAPTFGERPALLRDAIARARSVTAPARELLDDPAADLAERDDHLFARAQWMIRRALLARGQELGIDSDVFWLPFVDLHRPFDRVDARRRASAARSAAERAARWQMPLVVGGAAAGPSGEPLRGVGTGPRVTGRVVRFATLASAIAVGAGDVVVTRAVTPALAVLVAGCAALVSETGGLLDHGAALARELGIPCVVGCRDAWSVLADGMIVTVDGEAGVVTRT